MYCYHYNRNKKSRVPLFPLLVTLSLLFFLSTWLKSSEVVRDGTNSEAQAVIFAANVTQTHHLIKSNKV